MKIQEIMEMQKEFDRKHGWNLKSADTKELLETINKDLIGLFGEIGEFANLIKKLNIDLEITSEKDLTEKLMKSNGALKEELIDIFIYLIRISTHMNVNISDEYLRKLKFNEKKYKKYEIMNE